MLIAINKNTKKKIVSYYKTNKKFILENKENFICPHCKTKVIFVNAIFKIKHFRHKTKFNCEYEPETEVHIMMKKRMIDFLCLNPKECLEVNLGFAIPDIYIKNKKIAIECQASQISVRKFMERTLNYNKNGIGVLWIWDINLFREHKGIRLFLNIIKPLYQNRIYFIGRNEEIFSMQFQRPTICITIEKPNVFMTNGGLPEFLEEDYDLSELKKDIYEHKWIGNNSQEYSKTIKTYKIKIGRFLDKYGMQKNMEKWWMLKL